MILSRTVSSPNAPPSAPDPVREVLLRDVDNGFILYQSGGNAFPDVRENIVRLGMREALIWLNEASRDGGPL